MNINAHKYPQTRFIFIAKYLLFISDIVLLNLVFFGTLSSLQEYADLTRTDQHQRVLYRYVMPMLNLAWIMSVSAFGLYKEVTLSRVEDVYRMSWRSFVLHVPIFGFILIMTELGTPARMALLLTVFYIILAICLLLSRFIYTYGKEKLSNRKPVSVIGNTPSAHKLAEYFESHSHSYDLAETKDQQSFFIDEKGQLRTENLSRHFRDAASNGIQEVYISLYPQQITQAGLLIEEAEKYCLRVNFVPELYYPTPTPYHTHYLDDIPVISFRQEPMTDMMSRFKKRFFDISLSLLVIVFVLSWLTPLLAIIIKLSSKGPVLFRQQRSGKNNMPFYCYKFRSMRLNDDSDRKQTLPGDSRVTAIGNFMRRTSIDELPQFFNVLLGQMSVVGPRPHMLAHTAQYSEIIEKYMARHFIKPGVTGWAQVNGYRGQTKEPELMRKRVEHDLWYLENWTAMLDVRIVFLTIINLFKGEDNAH